MKKGILLLSVCVCLLCACSRREHNDGPHLKSVYLVSPQSEGGDNVLTFTGVVEEDHNISVGFKTAGQIKRLFVKEGDHVRSGQLLATLDDSDYRLGVEALQIQYDQVKDEVARAKRLYENKSMTANDFEKASAGLRQLAVQLQANKNKLAYTNLYAPTSGIIEQVNFSPAEMVDAGTAVFTMIGEGRMEVVCDITSKVYLERDRIVSVSCLPTHSGSEPIEMKVLSIVPKADSNQLYRMRLGFLSGSDNVVTPGMNVAVNLTLKDSDGSGRLIPASALFHREGKDYVWVMAADSTVSAREVVLGGSLSGKMAGVKAGLQPTDRIVRAGVGMLHEGEKVKVIGKPAETNVGELL